MFDRLLDGRRWQDLVIGVMRDGRIAYGADDVGPVVFIEEHVLGVIFEVELAFGATDRETLTDDADGHGFSP